MPYPLLTNFKQFLETEKIGTNRALIIEIQNLLKLGNFYKGDIDGIWGEKTNKAFIAFKSAAYLGYPNTIGETTALALLELGGATTHPLPKDNCYSDLSKLTLKLPGGKRVLVSERIPDCANFTWGEATAVGTRKPLSSEIVTRIIHLAQYLDRVKALFNNRRVRITSWYRPPDINRSVGGVANSTHILGSAVDFTIEGIPPLEVYRQLDDWHGRNGGLGRSSAFTHLDLRGYSARWNYGQ